ncbi:AraC family transcriptional regulator [Occultella aeris]|uniref:HTH-type transcriptional repressor of iron proteins A n=1 Tax=Occultella aeris TaxID=2761496 RepID=A0A7M4DIG5_9MICO|nr:AraC family transcriptional regulator [Occultella aeris]VZO36738.1 HTH-type transcriptional repressor of iron proteins A [Occultella aeris]
MMWVHTGQAHVRLADGQEHRVESGTGIWLPPGSDHDMWTEPGSLAFPTWVSPTDVPGAPARATRFTVSDSRRNWLIAQYAYALTRSSPSIGRQVSPGDLVTLLDHTQPRLQGRDGAVEPGRYPPMPRSATARKVAREILRDPALDQTVAEWAALASCSPNTLRRDFLGQTGMTFAQWRTLCRLAAACELLAAGYDVGMVAARAGFATRNGFTRAFREHHGMTPRDFAATAPHPDDPRGQRRVVADRRTGATPHLRTGAPASSQSVHATRIEPTVIEYNVLSWIYRGEGWARVGETTYPRRGGEAIWLPAGQENETGVPEGAVELPISVLDPDDARITEPLRARFPPSWETYLLWCSVSTNTLLRPEGYDPRHILDVFSEQVALERARTVPMPRSPRARESAIDYLRRIGSTIGSSALDVPRDVHGAFRRETGMSFARWRQAARMRLARNLLAGGTRPGAVASRVGYTHASNFSRAFNQFHGLSPREYQEQELDAPHPPMG